MMINHKIQNTSNISTYLKSYETKLYRKDSIIYSKGEKIDFIYIILNGSVESILDSTFRTARNSWKIANLRYFNPIGAHESGLIGENPLDTPNNLFPIICKVASCKIKELQM